MNINVHETLKRGTKLSLGSGESIVVMFKYERLPDFCFVSGRLDHHESECEKVIKQKKIS